MRTIETSAKERRKDAEIVGLCLEMGLALGMSKGFRVVWFVALAVFVIAGISLAVMTRMKSTASQGTQTTESPTNAGPLEPDAGVLGMSIPPFSLVDQDGQPVTKESLTGKVTVANFIFTHCVLVCPAMTDTTSKVVRRLKETPVRFMSFSVDPEHDTSARLKEFAAIYEADHRVWSFVTGEKGVVERILTDGLKFGVGPDPNPANTIKLPEASGGGTMANILHPAWYVLIGPDAKVLGIYSSSNPAQVDLLVQRARAAANALPR